MADEGPKTQASGGRVARTIIQLVVVSILVGAVFSFLGLGPREFWRGVFTSARNLLTSLGESFSEIVISLAIYLIIGAAVVVPIWLVARLLSSRK